MYGGIVILIRKLDCHLPTLHAHAPSFLSINTLGGSCTHVYVSRHVSIRTVVLGIQVSCTTAVAFRSMCPVDSVIPV